MKAEFTAIIEQAPEGGYWAICPEVPGANGQARSGVTSPYTIYSSESRTISYICEVAGRLMLLENRKPDVQRDHRVNDQHP